ncbi:MAG: restriction endonuclease subunit S, partial [Bacteroidales bacterium]|nr:restriction endonuclease subunit S [Bacteroidales bacterium]
DTAFGFSPKENVLPKFLFYFCKGFNFQDMNKGTTIPSLVKTDLLQIRIPIPSLAEQQRIVGILDQEFAKIDALKANAEKSLQAAKDLFRKSMDILLSPQANWTETTLGEICSKIGSGATPSGGKRAYQKEGISLIRSLNVHNNEFRYEDLAHINAIQASSLNNVEIHSGDVLFNITGASVTRCCLVPDDVIPARVNQHVSILRLIPETIIPALLVFILISPRQNELLMKTAENGATRQAITKRELEQWHIQYPVSTEEQQAIIAHLNDLDNKCQSLRENYQETLALCDDLKQSLLRKAFNGEL